MQLDCPISVYPLIDPKPWGYELVHTHDMSVIRNGKYRGCYLKDVIDNLPYVLKTIKTSSPLSVQNHPPGFPEEWYINQCDSKSKIYSGAKSLHVFNDADNNYQKCLDMLNGQNIKSGDQITIGSGVPHSIGSDVELIEVSMPKNRTFRLADNYGRPTQRNEFLSSYYGGLYQQHKKPWNMTQTYNPKPYIDKLQIFIPIESPLSIAYDDIHLLTVDILSPVILPAQCKFKILNKIIKLLVIETAS